MEEFVRNIAYGVLSCVVQLTLGSLISIPLYKAAVQWKTKRQGRSPHYLPVIAGSALMGMLLPLNIYGHLPLALSLLASGFSLAETVPLIISGALFNMTVPYADPGFIWETGLGRMGLAFAAGILAGLLFKRFGGAARLLRSEASNIVQEGPQLFCWHEAGVLVRRHLSLAGPFILLGVFFNVLFFRYVLWSVLQFIYTSPNTSFMPNYFAGLDVVNPFFLQTINIFYMLMNLITLSGLFAFMKPKGVFLYIAYYLLLAVLFGISAF